MNKPTAHLPIRVRFAPSPTGYLHIGGVRSALFNFLFARHAHGEYLLRIEDTDLERSKPEYTQAILDAFSWLDLKPDEPVVIQSERFDHHAALAQQLLDEGKAYRCYCTPEEVVERLRKQGGSDEFVLYDGHCRSLTHPKDAPFVIRFARPLSQSHITFEDLIRGTVTFEMSHFDDFILTRADGRPMYNFVVVIDDAFMRISHIIRGEEHLSNTPKQIMLYNAFGYALPQFAHLPMILGPSGNKLSKRDAATNVIDYRQNGYLPHALLNYLARLGWSHGDQEVFSRKELIEYFSLNAVGKKGAIFDQHKLDWINSVYLKQMSAADIISYAHAHMGYDVASECKGWEYETLCGMVDLYKERSTTIKQLLDTIKNVYNGQLVFDEQALISWITPQTAAYMQDMITLFEYHAQWTSAELAQVLKSYAQKQGLKLVTLAQPLRIALIGSSEGPGAFQLLELIGKDESLARLRLLHERISKQ